MYGDSTFIIRNCFFSFLFVPELKLWEEVACICYIEVSLVLKSSSKHLTELFLVEICCLYVLPVCIPLLGLSTPEGEGAMIDQNMGHYTFSDTA